MTVVITSLVLISELKFRFGEGAVCPVSLQMLLVRETVYFNYGFTYTNMEVFCFHIVFSIRHGAFTVLTDNGNGLLATVYFASLFLFLLSITVYIKLVSFTVLS